ncbi:hypothetical protein PHSY_001407 [Pseudozyma hubeiensis SY62]|uniref:Uncharacterized protein n=1 Tax=Pseudozyma hubeiensis (strain SY62) TaxID=1305764 RepID=R9NYX2_PSEHS|nr:hypothetical protein PHSY_001407 [Pseudozyma hubeiensis SY62]GAC93842.1 hypothetical protein PHSY_001407 [Pseudozyma hubeiensis SY62]
MDGQRTEPSPDPHVVLRQLIQQAEASTSSSSLLAGDAGSIISAEDDYSNLESDSNGSDDVAAHGSSSPPPSSPSVAESARPLSYAQLDATLASINADRRELATLLQHNKYLSTARKRNVKHERSLQSSLHFLSKTRDELKAILHSLDIADVVDAEDQSLEVIRTCKKAQDAAAMCPFRASMIQQIPLLRLQSIERAEYDNALGSRLWLDFEDAQLRSAVKAVALKAHTIALSMDPSFTGDPLAEAAKLDEVSALHFAEQIDAEDSNAALASTSSSLVSSANKGLDWHAIAARIPTRTMEEVKTRWYGVLRPSINTAAWEQHEVDDLIRIATPFLAAYLARARTEGAQSSTETTEASGSMAAYARTATPAPVPWQTVAQELGTGRTAHACFVAYCTAIVQRDQPDMTPAEDDNVKELFSLFRGAWRFMALHSSTGTNLSISSFVPGSDSKSTTDVRNPREASLLGKVGRDAQLLYRRFRNTIDPALATGLWSRQEDLGLIHAIRDVGQDNWAAVSARIPGRTSTQARERWLRRLRQIVAQAGPDATDEQIADLIEGKKKVRWTAEMDALVRECVDDGWRAKDGQTFADVASYVSGKLGVQLSDKSVRDRIKVLRSSKQGRRAQDDAKEGAPDGNTRKSEEPTQSEAAERNESLPSSSAANTVPDASHNPAHNSDTKPKTRPRTAILPGSKRRKL